MKSLYPEYKKKTEEECKTIWGNATIYIDTNVLIDLYSYSEETTNSFLDLIKELKERVYLPKRVVFEYTRKRFTQISDQKIPYDILIKEIDKIETELNSKRNPFLSEDLHLKTINIFEEIRGEVSETIRKKLSIIDNDNIYNRLCEYLDGRVLPGFTIEEHEKICTEGVERYKLKKRPGYMDIIKPDNEKYGDLLVWKEILNHAKETSLPVIFVTDDNKEGWLYSIGGQKIGVAPELIKEMRDVASVDVLIYSSSSFMKFGQSFLGNKVNEDAVEEIGKFERKTTHSLDKEISEIDLFVNSFENTTLSDSSLFSKDKFDDLDIENIVSSLHQEYDSVMIRLNKIREEMFKLGEGNNINNKNSLKARYRELLVKKYEKLNDRRRAIKIEADKFENYNEE